MTSFLPENKIIVSKPRFSELETRSSRLETRSVIESRESNRDCQLRACLQGERVTLVLGLPLQGFKLDLVYLKFSMENTFYSSEIGYFRPSC